MKHTAANELRGVIAFVAIIWGVYVAELVVPFELKSLGIVPRHLWGLVGIITAPFLHGSLQHLVSNTIPLFVLLTLLAGSRARSWEAVVGIMLLTGALLWVFGRPGVHIGASGLVFGLVVFLIVAGFLEKRLLSVAVAVLVGFLYGGTLLSGIVPWTGVHVSWEGHLCGAAAGAIVAYVLVNRDRGPAEPAEGYLA